MTINTSLPTIEQLPKTYIISLTEYGAISLSGEEQSKYLQGQVTCDVNDSNENNLLHGAHCNAKGKVISAFRLINREGAHLLLQPKSSITSSLTELKKFGIFAKVAIEEINELSFYALVGTQASTYIQQKFAQVPDSMTPVIQAGTTTLVYLAGKTERYLLIDSPENNEKIITAFKLNIYSTALWDLIEITEGFPMLEQTCITEYVPQMLNLQAINGISFTKGCYLGQETVARMQYLGKNKRALYSLNSTSASAAPSEKIIEQQIGENWRKAGDILKSYRADNGQLYIQAVLATDIDSNTQLRIKNQAQSALSISALPYALAQ